MFVSHDEDFPEHRTARIELGDHDVEVNLVGVSLSDHVGVAVTVDDDTVARGQIVTVDDRFVFKNRIACPRCGHDGECDQSGRQNDEFPFQFHSP